MSNSAITVKLEGVDRVLDILRGLPPEVVSRNGGVVRKVARRALMVVVRESRRQFRRAVAEAGKTGITQSTGFTERQIIARRRPPPPGTNGERVIQTVRYVPHPRGGTFRKRPLRANDLAYLMEYGSAKQPATPWVRPAFALKGAEAVRVAERDLISEVDKIVRKLGGKGGLG